MVLLRFSLPAILTLLLLTAGNGLAQDADSLEADSADAGLDSLSRTVGIYNLLGLNQHIGFNGFSFSFSFIRQAYGINTGNDNIHTFGAGISGDVLTGLRFIHLIPECRYWRFSENEIKGFLGKSTYQDISLTFNTVLISPRFTHRRVRVYAGVGPSLHFTIMSYYAWVYDEDVGDYERLKHWKTNPNFRNGLGIISGLELPLTGTISFIVTGHYKRTYEWDKLNRVYYAFSLGLAI